MRSARKTSMSRGGIGVLGIMLGGGLAVSAPLVFGCAGLPAARDVDGGPGVRLDAGRASDAAGIMPPGDAAPRTDAALSLGDAGGVPSVAENLDGAGCFDFLDTDTDGQVDCRDEDCSLSPLCCVGSSTAGCCTVLDAPNVFDFDGCPGGGAAGITDCYPSIRIFGMPQPELRGAGIATLGDGYDSGLVFDEIVDPGVAVVHASARVVTSEDAPCAGCIDFVAIGIVSGSTAFGNNSRVSADAAVLVNAARGEVRLLIGDTLVGSWPFSSLPTPRDTTYELIASPDGNLALHAGTMVLARGVRWTPTGPARIVAYGRSVNPGGATAPIGTAIAAITISSEICDEPSSIDRGPAAILPERGGSWTGSDQPSGASVSGDDMLFAFEGRIHRATQTAARDGEFRVTDDPHLPTTAVLSPIQDTGEEWRARSLSEPELVQEGGSRTIFFTATGASGRRVIGRAVEGSSEWEFTSIQQFYPPIADTSDTASYDGPSYLRTSITGTERRFLAVRRHTPDGGEIVLLELSLTAESDDVMGRADVTLDPAFAFSGDGSTMNFVHSAGRSATSFDADEIAAPGLVAYDGLIRLYFAGRRGTRWAIGMLASSDGRYWHLTHGGAALLAGSGAGFDAISVSEPEPVHVGRELRLYYTAHDGARRTIGLGRHLVTEVAP